MKWAEASEPPYRPRPLEHFWSLSKPSFFQLFLWLIAESEAPPGAVMTTLSFVGTGLALPTNGSQLSLAELSSAVAVVSAARATPISTGGANVAAAGLAAIPVLSTHLKALPASTSIETALANPDNVLPLYLVGTIWVLSCKLL